MVTGSILSVILGMLQVSLSSFTVLISLAGVPPRYEVIHASFDIHPLAGLKERMPMLVIRGERRVFIILLSPSEHVQLRQ